MAVIEEKSAYEGLKIRVIGELRKSRFEYATSFGPNGPLNPNKEETFIQIHFQSETENLSQRTVLWTFL